MKETEISKTPIVKMYSVTNELEFQKIAKQGDVGLGDLVLYKPMNLMYTCTYPDKLPSLDALSLIDKPGNITLDENFKWESGEESVDPISRFTNPILAAMARDGLI